MPVKREKKPNLHKKPAKHKVRRNVKDSIFCDLFSQKVYIKALFESLHNGESVEESEIEILTLKNKLKSTFYNDLGFCVKDCIIILVEAQSSLNENIVLRMFFYYAETLKRYIDKKRLDMLSRRALKVPDVECYMLYNGKERVGGVLSLKQIYGIRGIDFRVKVITQKSRRKKGDIVWQYFCFCEIVREVFAKFDRQSEAEEALKEICRLCVERGALAQYILTLKETEIMTMVDMVLGCEEQVEIHEEALRAEARAEGIAFGMEKGRAEGMEKGRAEGMEKGRAEGMEKGRAEGILEGMLQTLIDSVKNIMQSLKCSKEQAFEILKVDNDQREKLLKML